MSERAGRRRRPICLVALTAAFILGCGGEEAEPEGTGAAPSVSETPSAPEPTPAPTATPLAGAFLTPRAGAPADLPSARRLEAEGDLLAAASAYASVLAAGAPARNEATLAAARVLLQLERPQDVRILLEPFVARATGGDQAARYLLARSYAALSLWQQSLEQYDLYIAAARPALPYAYLDRSRALMELGRPLDAVRSAETGLRLGVPSGSEPAFHLAMAQAYERAGEASEAIRRYEGLVQASASDGDDALALSRIVAIKRSQNDPSYTEDLKRLLTGYASTSQARVALQDALDRGEAIDPTTRGLIRYRANDYKSAEPAFNEQLAAAPEARESAEAAFYLAAIREVRGDIAGALAGYYRAVSLNSESVVADDALWWQARIHETAGRLDEAGRLYARLVAEYPRSTWAADAAFRRGMLPYRAGRHAEAASIWAEGVAGATAEDEDRLALWQGKALLKAGNQGGARPLLEPLVRDGEDDYFGVRARSLLRGRHDQPKANRDSRANLSPAFDWAAAEAWLSSEVGRPVSEQAWSGDSRWLRAQELWLVGRTFQGDVEALELIETQSDDAIAMYTLSRALQAQGRVTMSGRAGQRLLSELDRTPSQGLPKPLLSLAYPVAFGPIVQKYANAERVSPLLVLALVRQESFFAPRAESPAGALGLTQVLPETASEIGKQLKVRDVKDEQLLLADLNLRFGVHYLAEQLRAFDNEIFSALAAYNAGARAAKRWRNDAGRDADLYLEAIEFEETRRYVQLVAENYAIYRYVYAGEAAPNLPE